MERLRGLGWAICAVLCVVAFWAGQALERHQTATQRRIAADRVLADELHSPDSHVQYHFFTTPEGERIRLATATDRQLTPDEAQEVHERMQAMVDSGRIALPWEVVR